MSGSRGRARAPARARLHRRRAGGVRARWASLLLGLRAAGAEVGWGFQLQSPVVVAVLAYVLFAVGLSLSGVFHLGGSLQGVGALRDLTRRSGLAGSFFTGVLAAVVATPCTAPFMATAVGFALTQPAGIALAVILALGLGLALPFLAADAGAAADRPPAAPRRLDGDAASRCWPSRSTPRWPGWSGCWRQQVGPAGLFAALVGLVLIGARGLVVQLRRRRPRRWGRRLGTGHGRRVAGRRRRRRHRRRSTARARGAPQIGLGGRLRALHARRASTSCWPPTAPCSST